MTKIFEAILSKTRKKEPNVSKTMVYHRIEAYQKKNKILLTSDAQFAYAYEIMGFSGEKLSKLGLREGTREYNRLYDFLRRSRNVQTDVQLEEKKEVKNPRIRKKVVVGFGLPPNLIDEASKMADVYPDLYQLENLVRYVILNVLEEKYTSNWWDNRRVVSKAIAEKVEIRKNFERQNRWVAKRRTHNIFYTDFSELARIINMNTNDFKKIFANMEIEAELRKLEPFRNIIAHNNPLSNTDIFRIKTALADLEKQLKDYNESQKKNERRKNLKLHND